MNQGHGLLVKTGEQVYYNGWLLTVEAISKKKGDRAPFFRLQSVPGLVSFWECTPAYVTHGTQ